MRALLKFYRRPAAGVCLRSHAAMAALVRAFPLEMHGQS